MIHSFFGGVFPAVQKNSTRRKPIAQLSRPPARVILPMTMSAGGCAAPLVQVGDRVKKGQPLCLLEAMKMMSEVTAPCDCEITAILKENGALVSFGDGLFGYKPC